VFFADNWTYCQNVQWKDGYWPLKLQLTHWRSVTQWGHTWSWWAIRHSKSGHRTVAGPSKDTDSLESRRLPQYVSSCWSVHILYINHEVHFHKENIKKHRYDIIILNKDRMCFVAEAFFTAGNIWFVNASLI